MSTALYVVIFSRGDWWVDVEGRASGPYRTKEDAAVEATHLARFASHSGHESEVLVPDENGRHRIVWASDEAPRYYAPTAAE
ncbi:MAG TPA: DUF2188 domain-containing protein [Devosiaceae bacterium]|jgi:hypothetical protein|nr:DUF2188 domain-containing protein [Devosiaceae bacterium]